MSYTWILGIKQFVYRQWLALRVTNNDILIMHQAIKKDLRRIGLY
jgi:hypothetical protein